MQTLARRLVTIPSYALLFAVLVGASPLWAPALVLAGALRRDGFAWFRGAAFAVAYLAAEMAGLLAAGGLWLIRPLSRWSTARWLDLHYRLQAWWGTTLFTLLVRCFDLRVRVEGVRASRLGEGPYLLLIRHTSAADTLLATALVARPHAIRLRYVLKRELLWDPCLDVVGARLPNTFVDRESEDTALQIAGIQALARGLTRRDGVSIYPEGTRFSEAKRERVLERLARAGDVKQLEYASALHHVLPPRPGGVLGLLDAAPGADAIVCAHAGFEAAASLTQLWRGALLGRRICVRFERVPRGRIPADREARAAWLRDLWRDVDAWVAARIGESAAAASA